MSPAPSTSRLVPFLTALVCVGVLAPRALAAEGPVLGTSPSGIVNDQGQPVGSGPPLKLVGPAPKEDPRDRYRAAVLWLKAFLDNLNGLERDMVKLKMALHTGAIDIRDLRERIRDLRSTRANARTDSLRSYCDETLGEKEAELLGVAAEQDKLVAGARQRWQDLLASLAEKRAECAEFPEFQQALDHLGRVVQQKAKLAELELYLSGGYHKEFTSLAVELEQDPALQMPVLLMKATESMDRGDGRSALYAARLGLERYPDNPAFAALSQGMDVSYLKLISRKAMGDGAEIHKLWGDYAGQVSDSVVKQFLFGSVRGSLDIATGKAFDLELVHKDAMVRATAEHNGLEVMWRLRDKGLSFDQIRALGPDELQRRLGLKDPLSPESVGMLHTSVQAAFENPDVRRLLVRSKDEFDVDAGKSYYGAEAFDTGILEYALDAVNVKNAILFFGPGAVVRYGAAEAGWLSKLSRLGVSGEQVAKEFEGAVTVRDWLLARPAMQEALAYVGSTRAGTALKNGFDAVRYLRHDASAPVKVATGLAEAGAQMLVYEAGGKLGKVLGGDYGEFIGQALAMLAGNPIEDLQQAETKALEQTAVEMAARRARWQAQNELLKEVRVPVRDAVAKLSTGAALSAEERAALETVAAKADTLAAAAAEGGPLAQAARDEATTLSDAAKAARGGDAAAAELSGEAAAQLEQAEQQAARTSEQAEAALKRAAAKGELPETVAARPGEPGEVLHLKSQPPPPEPPPTPPPPERLGTSARECRDLGEQAMKERRFEDAAKQYREGFRLERNDPDRAMDKFELEIWQNRVRDAEDAARHTVELERMAQNTRLAREIDQAMHPFTDEQRAALRNVKFADTVELTGTTGGPRKVYAKHPDGTNGELLGIWKPKGPPNGRNLNQMDDDGQLVAELLYSRLARRLGLRVPHAEAMSLEEVVGGQVVRHEGVLIRYIPQSRDLETLSRGEILALKQQVAKFRALQVLTGNYDIHPGNWRLDEAGNLWSIDAGMAMLETGAPPGYTLDQIAGFFRANLGGTGSGAWWGDDVLDYTRLWRDLYRTHHLQGTRETVRRLEELMVGADMAQAARQAKGLTPAEFDRLVDQLMLGHPSADNVKRTYRIRWEHLDRLLNEHWPGALPAGQALAPVLDLFGAGLRKAA